MGYGYALLKDGVPAFGGSKRYHITHQLMRPSVDIDEAIEMLETEKWKAWSLTEGVANNISDFVIKELKERKRQCHIPQS